MGKKLWNQPHGMDGSLKSKEYSILTEHVNFKISFNCPCVIASQPNFSQCVDYIHVKCVPDMAASYE